MEDNPGQYVKLKKENITDQPSTEPGELNQPVEVPILVRPRCPDCGLTLPQEVSPPQNEPWTTAIFGCLNDKPSCVQGLCCPCVLFGKNVEAIKPEINWVSPCVCHAIFVEGGVCAAVALTAFPAMADPGTVFFVGEFLVYAWWMCGLYTGLFRQELQHKYHLRNAPCDPCLVHCVCHPCALCQEHREMQIRLPPTEESAALQPPAEQEMAISATRSSEDPHSHLTSAPPL